MKILMVSAGLPDTRNGGLPSYLGELIGALLARGHQLHYLDTSAKNEEQKGVYYETSTRDDGLVITHFYNLKLFPDFGRGTLDPLAQVKPDPDFLAQFEPWLAGITIDLVHIHEFIGFPAETMAAFFTRPIPVMATLHDYYALCPTIKLILPDGSPCNKGPTELICRHCCRQGVSPIELKTGNWIKRISAFRGGSWLAGVVWPRIKPLFRTVAWWNTNTNVYRSRRERMVSILERIDIILGNSHLTTNLFRQIGGLTNVVADTTFTRKTIRHEVSNRSRKRMPGSPLRVLVLNVRRGPKGLDLLHRELTLLDSQGRQNLHFLAWGCSHIESPLVDNQGTYEGNQLDALCAEADVGLVPSVWREAYGFVGAEMLSRGLPVIASQTGAMKEYIAQGEDGLLFDPSGPGNLATVLNQLATDEVLLARLTKGATDGWKKFGTFDHHIETLLRHYETLIMMKHQVKSDRPLGEMSS
jgi:glycosyltransferase involved in cell wall biosynthesis